MLYKRAQGVIEFTVIFVFVLFFFVLFAAAIRENEHDKNVEKEKVVIQNVALDIQAEINIAAESTDGYSRQFYVPRNVLGQDYNVEIIENKTIYVSTDANAVSYRVFEVSGTIQKGDNLIIKDNGKIQIN